MPPPQRLLLRLASCAGAAAQILQNVSANAPAVTTNAPSLAPQTFIAPAPGPVGSTFSNVGCPTIMQYLMAYPSNFSDLITLINAAPADANISSGLPCFRAPFCRPLCVIAVP